MSYETVRFAAVKMTVRKTAQCSGCGKRLNRQRTFEQTLNPFNRNASGEPKTRGEILDEHRADAAEWKQQPETCGPCEEASA